MILSRYGGASPEVQDWMSLIFDTLPTTTALNTIMSDGSASMDHAAFMILDSGGSSQSPAQACTNPSSRYFALSPMQAMMRASPTWVTLGENFDTRVTLREELFDSTSRDLDPITMYSASLSPSMVDCNKYHRNVHCRTTPLMVTSLAPLHQNGIALNWAQATVSIVLLVSWPHILSIASLGNLVTLPKKVCPARYFL